MKNKFIVSVLFVSVVLSGCHLYYNGYIINKTKGPITITTKPSLLLFEKGILSDRLLRQNISENDSEFVCVLLPDDTLIFNSPFAYETAITRLDYLKIKRNLQDSVVMHNEKEIRNYIKRLRRRNFVTFDIGIMVTESFFVNRQIVKSF